MKYHYTNSELKSLLQSMVILIDTREQENGHIITYFDKKKIRYLSRKLEYGDYSCLLPASPQIGIQRDIYFTDSIVIERKASIEELSGNLTKDRTRFESELLRAGKTKLYLMIENENGYSDIVGHRYRTQYEPKSFIATLKTYEARYGLDMNFIPAACAGNFIYYTLFYHCREFLKGEIAV
ncbi:ERCC4-type nuclease [Sporomusaceae bacterium BoRhaA]|uniref:ERCC4 domain-containing protein n=1 Tax=Pelorhabdus rhamnosifermentans TaxID=2772457 RepID=UPI001C05EF52|nr:ERCC4 domain-containing protein [Pelorhabdus rhamnosifermentans]MBU2703182.1 ERCC4-type nuclease [Pelorhabdus rhamnosifermentans]